MNTFSRGKEGGKWDSKSVRNIITNPTYAGYNHFKPAHWSDLQRIITNGDHEPIVTKEEFKQAQTYIERRTNKHMSKTSYHYPFSGIVRCGKCGATYTGNSSKHGIQVYKSYRCYNNYSKNLCDSPSISETALTQLAFNHLFIIEDFYQNKEVKNDNDIDIQKEIEKSNRRRKNWMAALGDGIMSKDDYSTAIEEEDERMKEVYEILERQSAYTEPEIPLEELRTMILSVKDHWSLITEETQKQFIQSVFREITIEKEKDDWKIVDLLTV